jgi:hypothetical protein
MLARKLWLPALVLAASALMAGPAEASPRDARSKAPSVASDASAKAPVSLGRGRHHRHGHHAPKPPRRHRPHHHGHGRGHGK